MKKNIFILIISVILLFAFNINCVCFAETNDNTWFKFIKYDLCISDYEKLTEQQKDLCHFIYDTEQSADDNIVCERARRILKGDDVGERITIEQLDGAYGIWDNYSDLKNGWQTYIDCTPDIVYLSADADTVFYGSYQKCEYWLDDSRNEYVIFNEKASIDDTSRFEIFDKDDNLLMSIPSALSDCPYKDFRGDEDYMKEFGFIEKNGGYYYIKPNNTAVFAWSIYSGAANDMSTDKPFIIENEINGCPVTAIEKYALAYASLTEVILPDSIEFIDQYAFGQCSKLKKINFPKNLKYIGLNAFSDCDLLTDVKIDCPNLKISQGAFRFCDELASVQINADVIGENAFESCKALKTVEFGKNISKIGAKAFWECEKLSEIEIPENVNIIGQGVFKNTAINSIMLNSQISVIGALPYKKPTEYLNIGGIIESHPLTDEPVCVFDADCEIYGYANSEAERYADEYGLNFNNVEEPSVITTTVTPTSKPTATTVTTITTPIVTTEKNNILGNVNGDDKLDVRDCAFIASVLASGKSDTLTKEADFNGDGKVNVRDAAAIANYLVTK